MFGRCNKKCDVECCHQLLVESGGEGTAADCVDKSSAKKCKKVIKKDQCGSKKGKKCELSCGACDVDCDGLEDKKGSDWCGKKAKTAKKYSKLCKSAKKAKKCELTCCEPYED